MTVDLGANPHGVLGAHEAEDGVVVRALRPEAVGVRVQPAGIEAELKDPAGLWEALLPQARLPLDYQLEVEYPDGNTFTVRDPYSFLPTLGELDLHLAMQGRHEHLYERLGAHVRELDGVVGTAFAVWAPNARSVYDPNNGYALTRLNVDQREINRIDPTRSNQGQSYWISPVDNLALPNQPLNFVYEFWPTPVQGQQFQVLIQRQGIPFVNPTDVQPAVIPDELILWRAKYFAYQWAEANKSRFPALKLGSWSYLMREHNEPKQGWPRMLATVAKEDNNIRDNNIVYPERRLGVFPVDSGFWQHTDVGFMNWGGAFSSL